MFTLDTIIRLRFHFNSTFLSKRGAVLETVPLTFLRHVIVLQNRQILPTLNSFKELHHPFGGSDTIFLDCTSHHSHDFRTRQRINDLTVVITTSYNLTSIHLELVNCFARSQFSDRFVHCLLYNPKGNWPLTTTITSHHSPSASHLPSHQRHHRYDFTNPSGSLCFLESERIPIAFVYTT